MLVNQKTKSALYVWGLLLSFGLTSASSLVYLLYPFSEPSFFSIGYGFGTLQGWTAEAAFRHLFVFALLAFAAFVAKSRDKFFTSAIELLFLSVSVLQIFILIRNKWDYLLDHNFTVVLGWIILDALSLVLVATLIVKLIKGRNESVLIG